MTTAYAFRFLDGKGRPTGVFGLAVATDVRALRKEVEAYGDAQQCEIQATAKGASILLTAERDIFERPPAEDFDARAFASDAFFFGRWKAPSWKPRERNSRQLEIDFDEAAA